MSDLNGKGILEELEAYRLRSQVSLLEVKVPKEICEAGKAQVVGYEYGPNNTWGRVRSDSWLYYLKFPNESGWFLASQEEILKWQG